MSAMKRLFDDIRDLYEHGYTKEEIIAITGDTEDLVVGAIQMIEEAIK